jgi:pyruvate formate lyase activating enzyme
MKDQPKAKIHSIETLGALDGPGLRTVIFFQGCPLRCKFCHNVDSVTKKGGHELTLSELLAKIESFADYWGENSEKGGVTLSGGDPLFQWKFLFEFVKKLNEIKVNIALDTSLFCKWEVIKKFIPYIDLWMVSIKHTDPEKHFELTSVSNELILENIKKLDKKLNSSTKSKIRPRLLLIPGITDTKQNLTAASSLIKSLNNLEAVEILKYGTHGVHKWVDSFGKYPLEGVRSATEADVQSALKIMHLPDSLRIIH